MARCGTNTLATTDTKPLHLRWYRTYDPDDLKALQCKRDTMMAPPPKASCSHIAFRLYFCFGQFGAMVTPMRPYHFIICLDCSTGRRPVCSDFRLLLSVPTHLRCLQVHQVGWSVYAGALLPPSARPGPTSPGGAGPCALLRAGLDRSFRQVQSWRLRRVKSH